MADDGSAPVAGEQADHGGQVPAGALPHHPERAFRAEVGRVRRRPDHGRVAVLDGGGELVHGRQPVVHRHHHGADGRGDLAADPVAQPQPAAEDEPAPVEVDDQRPRTRRGGRRGVDPDREITARPGNRPVGRHRPGRGLAEDEAGDPALRNLPALQGDDLGVAVGRDRGRAAGHRTPRAQPQIQSCHRMLLCNPNHRETVTYIHGEYYSRPRCQGRFSRREAEIRLLVSRLEVARGVRVRRGPAAAPAVGPRDPGQDRALPEDELWATYIELGWLEAPPVELAIVLEELGYVADPTPFLATATWFAPLAGRLPAGSGTGVFDGAGRFVLDADRADEVALLTATGSWWSAARGHRRTGDTFDLTAARGARDRAIRRRPGRPTRSHLVAGSPSWR